MNFVLIGGCNFSNKENKLIHSKIIELSKKAKPRLLYIHVSSKKIDDIIKTFNDFDVDLKIYEKLSDVDNADIIYIGGGNTEETIINFKKNGLMDKLISVIDTKIICGVSAGAILWFEKFYSDTYAYIDNSYGYNFKLLDGIGYFKGYISPHFNEPGKEAFFDELDNNLGIGLENNTALFISDNSIDYILDRPKSAIYFYLDKKLYVLNDSNKEILLKEIRK
jgi:dipeptidase E